MPQLAHGHPRRQPQRQRLWLVVLAVFTSLFPLIVSGPTLADTKTFRMAFAQSPAKDRQYLFYQKIYTQAFKKLGYNFEYIVAPNKRCSYLLQSGQVDGEPQRIASYVNLMDNIVRVEEAIFVNRNIVIGHKGAARIHDLQQWAGQNIHVDYIRGSVWSEQNLRAVLAPPNMHAVDSVHQGLTKTKHHRTDFFLGLETPTIQALTSIDFRDSGLVVVGVVGENNSYPYFHRRHKDLAVKMAAVLREMKASGEYDSTLYSVLPFLKPTN